jgi:thymidylate synthase
MIGFERQYLDLLEECLTCGDERSDRTGAGTLGVFGRSIRVDLGREFPLLTTKRVHFKSVVVELLWMLAGKTDVRWLQNRGVSIWDEWADENGELGPVYGRQWRSWACPNGSTIDQISRVQGGIHGDPHGRRHLVSAWNPADLDDMALPPCHCLFQFYVTNDFRLSCQVYQRSADVFLGLPFNLASYALLTCMMAEACDLDPGELIHVIGDAHLYRNHINQAQAQLCRRPKTAPEIQLLTKTDITHFVESDIQLLGYDPAPAIRAEVAV